MHEFCDPLCVVGVVGGDVEDPACFEAGGDEVEDPGLDDAAFVVAGFGPWVGEVDAHPVEGVCWEHAGEDFDAVAAHHANVGDAAADDGPEEFR